MESKTVVCFNYPDHLAYVYDADTKNFHHNIFVHCWNTIPTFGILLINI